MDNLQKVLSNSFVIVQKTTSLFEKEIDKKEKHGIKNHKASYFHSTTTELLGIE